MPVATFPLCMSTQDENVSNDVLRLTCPQSSLLNLSIAAGKVWYRKKDAKKRNPLFFFPLCINPCYRHARYEDDLSWERVRRWDFEWNRVADIGGRHGSHLSEKKTSHKFINTLEKLSTLYLTRKGRKLFDLMLNSHLCQTVHSSLSFQGRFLQLFILCL